MGSMTREKAIKALRIEGIEIGGKANRLAEFMMALDAAQKALRPVSREQVERMRGEWIVEDAGEGDRRGKCSMCSNCAASGTPGNRFCHHCGSPMADEAVDIIMERLEALNEKD